MNTVTTRTLLFMLVFVPLSVSGCRSEPDTPWPMAAVEVSVTYRGKPLEAAVVTFTNSEGRPDSFGITDDQGKTQLTTYESGDGATLGKHSITVVKQEISDSKSEAPQDSPDYTPSPGASPPPVIRDLVPKKFATPKSSGLTAEIVEGTNQVSVDLAD